jgi:hypothetical protein
MLKGFGKFVLELPMSQCSGLGTFLQSQIYSRTLTRSGS